jgi:hypothetical protein
MFLCALLIGTSLPDFGDFTHNCAPLPVFRRRNVSHAREGHTLLLLQPGNPGKTARLLSKVVFGLKIALSPLPELPMADSA